MKIASNIRPFSIGLIVLAAGALVVTSGCRRRPYVIKPLVKTQIAERPADREMPIFGTIAMEDGVEIAIVQSRRCPDKSDESLQLQLEDLRQAGLAANADAIINVEVLPVRRSGWVSDPMTPFPSWKHGEWKMYVMRGRAIVYPRVEAALKGQIGEEALGGTPTGEILLAPAPAKSPEA